MSKLIDLTGQKFGRLTVLSTYRENGRTYCLCECECGNKKVILYYHLKNNLTKSCGCIQKKIKINNIYKKRLYNIWQKIKQRCYNSDCISYKNYGGRGIKICNEWLDNSENFYDWAINNGYKDDLTIDRIDNNGNYEPNNCRWVNIKTQCNNRRSNHLITYNNQTLTLTQWANKLGINKKTLSTRLLRGWDINKALTTS